MTKLTRPFIHGIAHCVFWLISVVVVAKIMGHSDARVAYGYLTGWWVALYFGYIARFTISSSVTAFFVYVGVGISAVFFDWSWFYKDIPKTVTFQYFIVLVIGAGVFVSPILINSGVRFITAKFKRQDHSSDR